MSFFETPARRLYFVRACGAFAIAAVIGGLPYFPGQSLDEMGLQITRGLAALCILLGLFHIWLARRAPRNEIVYDYAHAPPEARVPYLRKVLWLGIALVPIMSVWVIYELMHLGGKSASEAHVLEPADYVYDRFGFWPAAFTYPFFGALWCCIIYTTMKKMEGQISEQREEAQ